MSNHHTLKAQDFKDVFQNFLKISARTVSVKTLLSDRNLRRINYSPYYQRNYVWDNVKQTFFIESVILGTEIPPLVLFNTGAYIEVIDGRQRFETLKRFKENDFSLSINGLKELTILNKISFNKLSDTNKEIFLNSNIRIFEFEVVNQPNISDDTVDRVKKEIFRRYNTGITPLTKEELDNAKYVDDVFSELFKKALKQDSTFLKEFNECFFPKESIEPSGNNDGLISKDVDFIRRFRILNNFPISTYAHGSNRTEIIDLLYDFAKNETDDSETEFHVFKERIKEVISAYKELSIESLLDNKFIYECMLWAVCILHKEGFEFSLQVEKFKEHYLKNLNKYSEDSSFYYKSIIDRFTDTATFFHRTFGCDFSLYIKDESFKHKVSQLKQTEVDASKSIEDLSNLRLHKPNPIAIPIDEIRSDIKSNRYLIRPSYQRQEKINQIKASAIIESILLGIPLPPIFIYRRSNGSKEVVDGQQRLLSIIGFLGETYTDLEGELIYSKNNSFKLKGLKILTDHEGRNFNSLPEKLQDKIVDYVIDVIVIEESVNKNFDQIDLFIRLNYKPYPIKNNSFEMWNSIVDFEVINKVKKELFEPFKSWFFLREQIDGRPDRMQNEEMMIILAFITYTSKPFDEGVIGFFQRRDRITCRLKDKKGLGDFLNNLDLNPLEKNKFLMSIDKSVGLIQKFATLFGDSPTKEQINDFLNIKTATNFKRSLQDFYVIWLLIDNIPTSNFSLRKDDIKNAIRHLLTLLRNTDGKIVDPDYVEDFKTTFKSYIEQFK